jgi:hydrogenase expression/formation protein HypC
MCLAIPGQVIELAEDDPSAAVAEVGGVRRRINIDLLTDEGLTPGDWVLIHVGFAMIKLGEAEARDQLRLLSLLGEPGPFEGD